MQLMMIFWTRWDCDCIRAKKERYTMEDTGNSEILNGLISYWSDRSESYSAQNLAEMECWRKDVWLSLIHI